MTIHTIKKNLESRMLGNLHVRFGVGGGVRFPALHHKAQPAKKGVKNSLTGEIYDRPAKPAHKKIRVRALKALKELV